MSTPLYTRKSGHYVESHYSSARVTFQQKLLTQTIKFPVRGCCFSRISVRMSHDYPPGLEDRDMYKYEWPEAEAIITKRVKNLVDLLFEYLERPNLLAVTKAILSAGTSWFSVEFREYTKAGKLHYTAGSFWVNVSDTAITIETSHGSRPRFITCRDKVAEALKERLKKELKETLKCKL